MVTNWNQLAVARAILEPGSLIIALLDVLIAFSTGESVNYFIFHLRFIKNLFFT
jgi:hypothetical protein